MYVLRHHHINLKVCKLRTIPPEVVSAERAVKCVCNLTLTAREKAAQGAGDRSCPAPRAAPALLWHSRHPGEGGAWGASSAGSRALELETSACDRRRVLQTRV